MAAGSHFVKKNKSCILIWNGEKCDRKLFLVIQNGRRQPFYEQNQKLSIDLKCDWSSKMAAGSHFVKKKSKLRIALKWREVRSKFIFGHPKWGGGGASQWPACKPFGDIHSICPWANTPILVCKYFSTWVYKLSPGWKHSHLGGNLGGNILPGWKSFQMACQYNKLKLINYSDRLIKFWSLSMNNRTRSEFYAWLVVHCIYVYTDKSLFCICLQIKY